MHGTPAMSQHPVHGTPAMSQEYLCIGTCIESPRRARACAVSVLMVARTATRMAVGGAPVGGILQEWPFKHAEAGRRDHRALGV